MDQELKQHLEAMEARLEARLDAMESRLEVRLDAKLDARLEATDARIEKVETNLLSAFHGWARGMEIRVRGVSTISTGFDERLTLVEERISELERRKAS